MISLILFDSFQRPMILCNKYMEEITKKQRQIFKCLDLTEGKIKTMIGKLRV